jgi:hypothetical protein
VNVAVANLKKMKISQTSLLADMATQSSNEQGFFADHRVQESKAVNLI